MTLIGPIPSWGLNVGFEKSQLKGIEKHYKKIKEEGVQMMQDLLSLDKEGKPTFDAVKKYLQQKYPESDAASLQKAAENLTSVFALAEGIEKDDAAKLIAERYADSWRNNAIQGLPKGWKPTGAALGVQFLA